MTIEFGGTISATVKIRDQSYTLNGTGSFDTGATPGQVQLPAVRLVYNSPFLKAIPLPSLGDIADTTSLFGEIISTLNIPNDNDFRDAWTSFSSAIKQIPGDLGEVFDDLEAVEVRITDIELVMDAPPPPPPGNPRQTYKKGRITVGLGFDCSAVPRTLLGIKLQAVGVRFSVNLET
jgi:hypothetical protein